MSNRWMDGRWKEGWNEGGLMEVGESDGRPNEAGRRKRRIE